MIFLLSILTESIAVVNQAEITVSKYPNRILVYCVEGAHPMFFDIDGRGTEILPTGTYYGTSGAY